MGKVYKTKLGDLDSSNIEHWATFYNMYSLEGVCLRQLSIILGIRRESVKLCFINLGLKIFPSTHIFTKMGWLDKNKREDWVECYSYYEKVMSLREVGKKYGLSKTTLRDYFSRLNFKLLDRELLNASRLERAKKTNILRYGFDNPLKNEEVKKKLRESCRKSIGYDSPFHSPERQEVFRRIKEVKYGDRNYRNINKVRETMNREYGRYYNNREKFLETMKLKSKEDKEIIMNKIRDCYNKKNEPIIKNRLLECGYEFLDNFLGMRDCLKIDKRYKIKHTRCGNMFYDDLRRTPRCPKCFPKSISLPEVKVREYVESLGFEVEVGRWDLIKSKSSGNRRSIDIYIPELKIALEYNGYAFHLEHGTASDEDVEEFWRFIKPIGYHEDKRLACEEAGIKLYYLWENRAGDNIETLKQEVFTILEEFKRK